MKRFITLIFFLFAFFEIFGQRLSITLTFSAVNNLNWVQLDSIKVMNRTQGSDTVLYYPDTVLVMDDEVGMPEPHKTVEGFQVFQNYPNPVGNQTTINVYVPSKDNVSMVITDVLGRVIIRSGRVLDEGYNSFRFVPGDGSLYFFTAQWKGYSSSIKILQANLFANGACSLEYLGSEPSSHQLKVAEDIQNFSFSYGDELLYIGYIDSFQSGLLDAPQYSKSYTFQFATNIPCPETPTVDYAGQVYNTIQIFSQCWLKENLNVGIMIPGYQEQSDNLIIEKYCLFNEADSCDKYGGLYQWKEMMEFYRQPGWQGICPTGWHLPTDEEWKLLEGAVDSHYRIGDPEWDFSSRFRGYNAGKNLKTTSSWMAGGNGTDSFGFSCLPGGYRAENGGFGITTDGYWWSTSEWEDFDFMAWRRNLTYNNSKAKREVATKECGYSVRCLKDD